MNRWTSQQRKLMYLAGILLLLIPITQLGMPPDKNPNSGGSIARLRQQLDLGESDLGQLDPAGAAMNLALLGLRGIAANVLWIQAEQYKIHKDWEQMKSVTEQIVRLQPHYIKVWDYHAWNLAYNVSAEWDAVPDRYFWVKEGGKFLFKGVERNRNAPSLPWTVGRIYGHKIGMSDEARYFRRYFRSDPDEKRYGGGVDPEWNERDEDNYIVAKRWFQRANEVEALGKIRETPQDKTIFRSYPARSQLDYAGALQKFGFYEEFDRQAGKRKLTDEEREQLEARVREELREKTRQAWREGFEDWTNKYGQELYTVNFLGKEVTFRLEMTADDIHAMAKSPEEEQLLKTVVDQYQKMTNYRYWRTRALSEAEPETAEAHWQLFAAGVAYHKADPDKAIDHAWQAMNLFEKTLEKYPELRYEDNFAEQACTAVLVWDLAHKLKGIRHSENFPLKTLWQEHQERLSEYLRYFERRFARD
ncbi:MAG: hypothetical protein KatS3mg114_0603 [Planctomycetaceae bacterium]|nr:MAG: hypothetical protein KatS3mg114_0603 [Planctomycetaceae bacterium]